MSVLRPQLNLSDTVQSRDELRSPVEQALVAVEATRFDRDIRVLIVDDHIDSAEALGMALEFLGYDVSICTTGLECLAAVERLSPDVAILDIRLPDISGYDLARMIAATSGGKEVKLVAVTGWGTADDRGESDDAGFHV